MPSECTAAGWLPPVPEPLPAICDCGAVLHAEPAGDRDWLWVDEDGHAVVDTAPAELRADPKGWWEALARDDIAAYSALTAREALCGTLWLHVHRPAVQEPYTGPVPYCCGMPMRATPAGWECRQRPKESHDRA